MSKKFTITDVHTICNERGFKLLEAEYKNNYTPLLCICSCGNVTKISLKAIKNNQKCMNCNGSKKLTNNEVKKIFSDKGCILLDIYKNNKTPMKFICKCGNIAYHNLNNFKYKNCRCKNCKYEKVSNSMTGENNPNYNKNRNQIKNIKSIHSLSQSYKQKYRKEYKVDKNIHIDHIFPIKAFIENNIFDLDIINDFDNFQTLDASTNISKGSKYDKIKFIEYLNNKLGK